MVTRAAIGALLLCASCMPGDPDVTGKRCTEERSCGEGFFCVQERCQRPCRPGEDCTGGSGGDGGGTTPCPSGQQCSGCPAGGFCPGPCPSGEICVDPPDPGPDPEPCTAQTCDVNLLQNPGFETGNPPDGWSLSGSAIAVSDASSPKAGAKSMQVTSSGPFNVFPSAAPIGQSVAGALYCGRIWLKVNGGNVVFRINEASDPQGGQGVTAGPTVSSWTAYAVQHQAVGGYPITLRLVIGATGSVQLNLDEAELWRSPDGTCQ